MQLSPVSPELLESINRYLNMPIEELYKALPDRSKEELIALFHRRSIEVEGLSIVRAQFWKQRLPIYGAVAFLSAVISESYIKTTEPRLFMKFCMASINLLVAVSMVYLSAFTLDASESRGYDLARQFIYPRHLQMGNTWSDALAQQGEYNVPIRSALLLGFVYSLGSLGFNDTMRGVVALICTTMSLGVLYMLAQSLGVGAVGALPIELHKRPEVIHSINRRRAGNVASVSATLWERAGALIQSGYDEIRDRVMGVN
jgi:hypothetical protein